MIFVTVGHQMSFDRLVATVDAWAAGRPDLDVFAQIGPTDLEPRNLRWANYVSSREFVQAIRGADLVIAHAGMGTIIQTLDAGRPLLILPRRAVLGETRNDHQVATAKAFSELHGIPWAEDEHDLRGKLEHLDRLPRPGSSLGNVSDGLVGRVREIILG